MSRPQRTRTIRGYGTWRDIYTFEALPTLVVSQHDASRFAHGQGGVLRGRDAPVFEGAAVVMLGGAPGAFAERARGELQPKRIFSTGPQIDFASMPGNWAIALARNSISSLTRAMPARSGTISMFKGVGTGT